MKQMKISVAALLLATPLGAQTASGDVEIGAAVFQRQCIACHVVEDGDGQVLAGRNARIGPNLFGVVGAIPGSQEDFAYSDALLTYGETGENWAAENFIGFVQDPSGFLSAALGDPRARSKMAHRLRSEQDAQDVFSFLVQYSVDTEEGETAPQSNDEAAVSEPEVEEGDFANATEQPAEIEVDATTAYMTASEPVAISGMNTTRLRHTLVLEGLDSPWDMAFLTDGTMFFTERCDGLSVLLPDGEVKNLLGMSGVDDYGTTAADLFCEGQAGMMGVAVDPAFDANRRIYVYATSNLSDPHTNRLMRLVVNDDFSDVSDRTDIVDDIPYKMEESDQPFGGPGAHNGGRVRFSPGDGFLYLTTGDNHNPEVPQSPTLMGSKVLRIDTDGNAAPANTPPEGFDPRTYTYGHRNVQGIAFHPDTNVPLTTEHGPWHSDEITVLENGGNGGWDPRPNLAGRGDCPDNYCGYEPNQMEGMNRYERAMYMPMTDLESYPNAMPPIWDNNGYSQGMASAAFLQGEQWGDWDGNLVVGFLGIGFGGTPIGQRIDVIALSSGDDISVVDVTEMTLPMGSFRFRSLVLGPDGSLFAAVDEGVIFRMAPGNR